MRLPGHHREMPGQGDQDKVGDSLLEKGVLAIAKHKVRKWGENMTLLAEKSPMQSNTIKGTGLGVLSWVVIALLQLFRGKLIALGLDPAFIDQLIDLVKIPMGVGAGMAAIGLRQAQDRAITPGQK